MIKVKFDRKLLDYDYGEEEEESGTSSTAANVAGPNSDSLTRLFDRIFIRYISDSELKNRRLSVFVIAVAK